MKSTDKSAGQIADIIADAVVGALKVFFLGPPPPKTKAKQKTASKPKEVTE